VQNNSLASAHRIGGCFRVLIAASILLAWPLAAEQVAISVQSHLVLVPVTVTDRNGNSVTGLEREHFQVLDNSELREIVSFSREDGPMSLGVVLDLSGSMKNKLHHAASAVRAITALAGPEDDAFLLTFGDRPAAPVKANGDIGSLANHLLSKTAHGYTALIDAVYKAMNEVRSMSNQRKALVVISDGGDNFSRYSESELKRRAMEADVQIYAISIVENSLRAEERRGVYLLKELATTTGGLHFTIRDRTELPAVAEKLARAMKDVYVIGYKPPGTSPGKWRKVRVSVTAPTSKSVRVSARPGYYDPE
jgi:Ca-activated chloride channel family protein